MRIIPSVIDKRSINYSERRVFDAFSRINLTDNSILFHSLKIPKHITKREGEADFVFVGPDGVMIIEVKGGIVKKDTNGRWVYSDSKGEFFTKNESPMDQARDNMYSIKQRIGNNLAKTLEYDINWGYGVIFTNSNLNKESFEWDSDLILNAKEFNSPSSLENFLKNLSEYFLRTTRKRRLKENEIKSLSKYFRPIYDKVADLSAKVGEINYVVHSLTDQQYELLDGIEKSPRIIIEGGAGTGKTFMAVETAKRNIYKGNKILFIYRSPLLITQISKHFSVEDTICIKNYDDFLNISTSEKYDLAIIDEFQDISNFETIEKLDTVLIGGLEQGKWRLFLDQNYQTGLYDKFDNEALEYITSIPSTTLTLNKNCRNTNRIIQHTELITGADMGKKSVGDGPLVEWHVSDDFKGLADKLKSVKEELFNEGLDYGDCIFLVREFRDDIKNLFQKVIKKNISFVNNSREYTSKNIIQIARIKDFKGLEKDAVVIILTSQDKSATINELYVGMSRAKVKLIHIIHSEVEKNFIK